MKVEKRGEVMYVNKAEYEKSKIILDGWNFVFFYFNFKEGELSFDLSLNLGNFQNFKFRFNIQKRNIYFDLNPLKINNLSFESLLVHSLKKNLTQ